ncbi:potassium channel family protein [Gallaecimonas sp. GXIMD4217]|uniref:potassium channel family protein n=1 Tax=Gallaecimonas sp. GXIMD4217 TaxID=3131927 RepID=UPI00311AF7DF
MKAPLRILPPSAFELAMMVLSILSVVIIVLHQFGPFSPDEKELLLYVDTGICLIFLTNFFSGLIRASDKKRFIRTHWIDFLASIPAVDVLRYGRIFQVLRVMRMLRVANQVIRHLMKESESAVLASMLLIMVVVVGGSAIAILLTEAGREGSNIATAEDAIWWSLVTISTVGYGDYYPVTTAGRIISAVVIIAGVSLFGGLSGLVASKLLHPKTEESLEESERHLAASEDRHMADMKAHLAEMKNEMSSLKEDIRELKSLLKSQGQ